MSGQRVDVSELRAALVAEIQSRFVAVVAVGDDDFFIRHGVLNTANERAVGDRPQPVRHFEFVMQFQWRGRARNFFQVGVICLGASSYSIKSWPVWTCV